MRNLVVVLMGGLSGERKISFLTGKACLNALKKKRYKVKELDANYSLPVFPEDYAYYLLSDNETLIMISGIKSIRSNFKFNLKKNKLEKLPTNNSYKLYISSLLKDCGYEDINSTYKCSFYKPLISENLIN